MYAAANNKQACSCCPYGDGFLACAESSLNAVILVQNFAEEALRAEVTSLLAHYIPKLLEKNEKIHKETLFSNILMNNYLHLLNHFKVDDFTYTEIHCLLFLFSSKEK